MPPVDRDLFVLAKERQLLANVPESMPVALHLDDELVFNKLAEHTDYRNGQIGFDSAISAHKIASELAETMPRKAVRNRSCVDRRAVLRSIDRLVKVGLFERHTKDRKLMLVRVFYRNFVAFCKSVQIPEGRPEGTEIRNSLKILSYTIRDLHDFKKVIHSSDGTADGIHNNNSTTTSEVKTFPVDKFALSTGFQFDTDTVKQLIELHGFESKNIQDRWTAEFIAYWWSTGEKNTARQWHHKYSRAMVVYLENPELFDELNGGKLIKKPKASVSHLIPRVPTNQNAMISFARKFDFREARPGESLVEYKAFLESERTKRLDQLESDGGG